MNTQMDRRRLLRMLVALSTSFAMSGTPAFGASADCSNKVLDDLDLAAVRELGREYLAQRPDVTSVDAIATLFASSDDEAEVMTHLRAKAQADFTAGRIVNLAGWFVSETEGRVFAALSRCGF